MKKSRETRNAKRLKLSRNTVRRLDERKLADVAAATGTQGPLGPTGGHTACGGC